MRPTSDDAVPPAPDQAAGAGRRVASRIVAFLRAESSLALAAFSIVPIRIIADTPNIGEVGHFGFLTQFLLVYILLVVVFAALGVVRHAERLAEKYGEPYGTLILTVSLSGPRKPSARSTRSQSRSNSLPAISFITGRPLSCTQSSRTPRSARTRPSPRNALVLIDQSRTTPSSCDDEVRRIRRPVGRPFTHES